LQTGSDKAAIIPRLTLELAPLGLRPRILRWGHRLLRFYLIVRCDMESGGLEQSAGYQHPIAYWLIPPAGEDGRLSAGHLPMLQC
jgi:hypothetical protein